MVFFIPKNPKNPRTPATVNTVWMEVLGAPTFWRVKPTKPQGHGRPISQPAAAEAVPERSSVSLQMELLGFAEARPAP